MHMQKCSAVIGVVVQELGELEYEFHVKYKRRQCDMHVERVVKTPQCEKRHKQYRQ